MDHDLMVDCKDLQQYGNKSLTPLVIQRIISGHITRFHSHCRRPKVAMSYREFVWLLISDQDKRSETR